MVYLVKIGDQEFEVPKEVKQKLKKKDIKTKVITINEDDVNFSPNNIRCYFNYVNEFPSYGAMTDDKMEKLLDYLGMLHVVLYLDVKVLRSNIIYECIDLLFTIYRYLHQAPDNTIDKLIKVRTDYDISWDVSWNISRGDTCLSSHRSIWQEIKTSFAKLPIDIITNKMRKYLEDNPINNRHDHINMNNHWQVEVETMGDDNTILSFPSPQFYHTMIDIITDDGLNYFGKITGDNYRETQNGSVYLANNPNCYDQYKMFTSTNINRSTILAHSAHLCCYTEAHGPCWYICNSEESEKERRRESFKNKLGTKYEETKGETYKIEISPDNWWHLPNNCDYIAPPYGRNIIATSKDKHFYSDDLAQTTPWQFADKLDQVDEETELTRVSILNIDSQKEIFHLYGTGTYANDINLRYMAIARNVNYISDNDNDDAGKAEDTQSPRKKSTKNNRFMIIELYDVQEKRKIWRKCIKGYRYKWLVVDGFNQRVYLTLKDYRNFDAKKYIIILDFNQPALTQQIYKYKRLSIVPIKDGLLTWPQVKSSSILRFFGVRKKKEVTITNTTIDIENFMNDEDQLVIANISKMYKPLDNITTEEQDTNTIISQRRLDMTIKRYITIYCGFHIDDLALIDPLVSSNGLHAIIRTRLSANNYRIIHFDGIDAHRFKWGKDLLEGKLVKEDKSTKQPRFYFLGEDNITDSLLIPSEIIRHSSWVRKKLEHSAEQEIDIDEDTNITINDMADFLEYYEALIADKQPKKMDLRQHVGAWRAAVYLRLRKKCHPLLDHLGLKLTQYALSSLVPATVYCHSCQQKYNWNDHHNCHNSYLREFYKSSKFLYKDTWKQLNQLDAKDKEYLQIRYHRCLELLS